jgi:hypothetical protein
MIDSKDKLSELLTKAKLLDTKRHILKSEGKLSDEGKEKLRKEIHNLEIELES